MTHSHNTMIVLSIFMYFFFWINSWKLLFLKKNSMKRQPKQKKIKSSMFSCYFYFLHFFWRKTPKITQCKIFATIFFGLKKLLYATPIFFSKHHTVFLFSKTPIFILHSVLCRCNFWCTPECNCKKKYTALQCLVVLYYSSKAFLILCADDLKNIYFRKLKNLFVPFIWKIELATQSIVS
jgi:hypothetical protein